MPSNAVTVIHKFIRREMFDLAERLFRAGTDDVDSIRSALEDLAAILRGHAEHEDASFAPRVGELDPQAAIRMKEDHHKLDDQLDALCNAARRLDPHAQECTEALLQLHLDWNRYLSAYLAHLDDEERMLFPLLKDEMPPVSAIAHSAIAQDAEQREAFLLRVWSVSTCEERMAIEGAVHAAASTPHKVAAEAV